MLNLENPSLLHEEDGRLKELYSFDILDTNSEKEFDELVEIASQICGCPVATITFVDKDRQWFKAKKGYTISETARNISFCAHTILSDHPLIVEDSTKDERFKNNPEVTGGSKIRFYAGVPIFSRKNIKLGAVCVIDDKPRSLSDVQIATLKLISQQITNLLELRLRKKLLENFPQEVLDNSDKSFEFFFTQDGVPKWIYEFDSLKFLQVNDAAIKKYGYTRKEFLELNVFDVRAHREKKNIHQLVQSVKDSETPSVFTTAHQTKDGRIIHVEVTVTEIIYMGKAARMASMFDTTEKERLKKTLIKQKMLLAQKIREAEIAATAETKDMIGKELHDNINQILASIKLFLDVAENREEMRMDMIKRSKENVMEAIAEIKYLSKTLVTVDETDFVFSHAIKELINSYSIVNSFKINTLISDIMDGLPYDLKLNLFRILQEQLNNISKYAEASEVWINIHMIDKLILEIKDNGKGFDTSKKRNGIGLNNIKKRTEFYKGTTHITSGINNGTCLYIEIPLEEATLTV